MYIFLTSCSPSFEDTKFCTHLSLKLALLNSYMYYNWLAIVDFKCLEMFNVNRNCSLITNLSAAKCMKLCHKVATDNVPQWVYLISTGRRLRCKNACQVMSWRVLNLSSLLETLNSCLSFSQTWVDHHLEYRSCSLVLSCLLLNLLIRISWSCPVRVFCLYFAPFLFIEIELEEIKESEESFLLLN